ncbi:hypothetical protein [Maribacter dokdonensis]|uniref:hypothetical protein n=1 Tax=Maribacter dokdonensis TaxID=320912 RepID=UPI0027344EC6|nr:hypothetical protein [Maribacter dokdonensis]MDP2527554.1 hypothetical protein [Maribacter dokdonensis]
MKSEIGNIFLIWRKGPGSRRIVVGKINKNSNDGARFQYLLDNLKEAEKQGFLPYTGFPDTSKIYTNNVLEILSQRIVKTERNDLSDYYSFWCVELSKKKDTYYMLAYTQGLLPTDNFEFLADFNPKKGLKFISEIAGLTKTKIASNKLFKGDKLDFELELDNIYDDNAVKLFKKGKYIGYVKLIHSRVFHRSKNSIIVTVHHLEEKDIIQRAFIKVEII